MADFDCFQFYQLDPEPRIPTDQTTCKNPDLIPRTPGKLPLVRVKSAKMPRNGYDVYYSKNNDSHVPEGMCGFVDLKKSDEPGPANPKIEDNSEAELSTIFESVYEYEEEPKPDTSSKTKDEPEPENKEHMDGSNNDKPR